MKSLAIFAASLVLGLTLVTSDAEAARRLGGGGSSGMQRNMQPAPKPPTAAPAPSQATSPAAPAPTAAAQPKRSWMGPLAGLAAGIGLAALASHFGFGEEMASMLLIAALVVGAMFVFRLLSRRQTAAGSGGLQYAGAGSPGRPETTQQSFQSERDLPGGAAAATQGAGSGNVPAGFDVESFVRNAKVNFIRLQAANDAGNIEDIREFTTPEMFGEIKLAMGERGKEAQQTDVVTIDAQVLDVTEEPGRYIASIRFNGLIREAANAAAEPFDEIWHLTKPRDGSRGWVLAGIQQVS